MVCTDAPKQEGCRFDSDLGLSEWSLHIVSVEGVLHLCSNRAWDRL